MIRFSCDKCSTKIKAKNSVAGQKLACPKCSSYVSVPFPGKEFLRSKCLECGTEHDLNHSEPCMACGAPRASFKSWCSAHRCIIKRGVCPACLKRFNSPPKAPSESDDELDFGSDSTSEPTPRELRKAVVNSRFPLWFGIIALITLVYCPVVAFFAGLMEIGFAANCDQETPRELQVGKIRRRIVFGYIAGTAVAVLDVLRTLIFVIWYIFF